MGETPFFKAEPLEKYYDIEEEIGSGQFAVVRRVVDKTSGIEYAGKFIRKKRSKAKAKGVTREAIEREGKILKISQHHRIIYLHDAYENPDEFILILELLSGGELFDFLGDREYLTEEEAVDFTRQIVDAIYYLHENKVAHLDLKPENIVLKNPYDTAIKLVDFGLARQLRFGEQVREIMGTPEFVAPEVINFDPIGLFTDMWAIGVLTFILLSGASPFLGNNVQETFEYISAGDYDFDDEAFDSVSEDAKDFISRLLIKDVRRRMTARECLEHPWLNNREKEVVQSRQSVIISTQKHRSFVARRRWQISLKKIRAINKFCMLSSQKEGQKIDSSSESDDEEDTEVMSVAMYCGSITLLDECGADDELASTESSCHHLDEDAQLDMLSRNVEDTPPKVDVTTEEDHSHSTITEKTEYEEDNTKNEDIKPQQHDNELNTLKSICENSLKATYDQVSHAMSSNATSIERDHQEKEQANVKIQTGNQDWREDLKNLGESQGDSTVTLGDCNIEDCEISINVKKTLTVVVKYQGCDDITAVRSSIDQRENSVHSGEEP